MTLEFRKLHNQWRDRRGRGATALVAAAWRVAGPPARRRPPVLQTLTYTSTGPGGGLYRPAGVSAGTGTVYVSNTGAKWSRS